MADETRRRCSMAIFIRHQCPTRAAGGNAQSANGLPTQLSTASKSSLHPAPRQLLYRFLWACVFIVFVPLLVYAACRHFGLTQKNAGCLALFWWILPWGFALFHPRRQFLYDYLAGTELIDLREQKK